MSAVISVTRDDFSASATRDGASIIAWLKGTADYAALDDVDLLLSRVHAEATEAERYKVRLLSNPNLHWQKRSLHSLRCFAIELITIEVKA